LELETELLYHLERQIEQNIKSGMNPDEARIDALRTFGGFEQTKEYCRDARGVRTIEELCQDARYGVRTLLKTPSFTLITVATLALGISANTIIFSCADATLLRPFSFPNQERLLMLLERNPEVGLVRGSVSTGDVFECRTQAQMLEEIIAIRNREYVLAGDGASERYTSYEVSAAFFDALGVQPQIGRGFQQGEDNLGFAQVVVLRWGFWQTRFGGDSHIIGKHLLLNNKPFEVIGVMPEHFEFPYGPGDMWTPLVFEPRMMQDHSNQNLRVLALLRRGNTVEQANAELRNFSVQMQEKFPEQEAGRTIYAVALNKEYTRVALNYVPMMIGAALLVLLIACFNAANLVLARAATRRREMAIRVALGATRLRILRQLLTENLLLALCGGLLGCLLAGWGIAAVSRAIPTDMSRYFPGWSRLGLNNTVLLFTFFISVLTGVLFGLAPAWQATNNNLNETLKKGRGTSKRRTGAGALMQHALVISQFAFSLMLLISAGLFVRSFVEIVNADLGIKPAGVVTMNLDLPRDQYASPELQRNLYQQLLERAEALPGVTGVGAINMLPLSGNRRSGKIATEDRPFERGKEQYTQIRVATSGYFAAIGTDLLNGRLIDARDNSQAPPVVLVNETFARSYFGDVDIIGRRIQVIDVPDTRFQVIGVIADAIKDEMVEVNEPGIYLSFEQHPAPQMSLVISVADSGEQIAGAVRRELAKIDSGLALADVKTMEQIINERRSPQVMTMWTLVIFAVAALLMAAIGMYAVIRHMVTQRTNEIGVRMALGAQSGDVLKLIIGRGLKLIAIGTAIGLAGAFSLTRLMRNLLYGVSSHDPLTFFAVLVVLMLFALLACYIPARRATKVDPLITLRYD
jgi:putative ABC transport system permease protein